MIGSTRQVAIWAYGVAADLRKGFDGLSALVSQGLGRDPLSGDCYLFVNATHGDEGVAIEPLDPDALGRDQHGASRRRRWWHRLQPHP